MTRTVLYIALLGCLCFMQGCATAVMSGAGQRQGSAAAQEDARITRDIRTAIYREAMFDDAWITVTAEQGVVTLSGRVQRAEQISQARQVAEQVPGVRQVIVDLRVQNTPVDR